MMICLLCYSNPLGESSKTLRQCEPSIWTSLCKILGAPTADESFVKIFRNCRLCQGCFNLVDKSNVAIQKLEEIEREILHLKCELKACFERSFITKLEAVTEDVYRDCADHVRSLLTKHLDSVPDYVELEVLPLPSHSNNEDYSAHETSYVETMDDTFDDDNLSNYGDDAIGTVEPESAGFSDSSGPENIPPARVSSTSNSSRSPSRTPVAFRGAVLKDLRIRVERLSDQAIAKATARRTTHELDRPAPVANRARGPKSRKRLSNTRTPSHITAEIPADSNVSTETSTVTFSIVEHSGEEVKIPKNFCTDTESYSESNIENVNLGVQSATRRLKTAKVVRRLTRGSGKHPTSCRGLSGRSVTLPILPPKIRDTLLSRNVEDTIGNFSSIIQAVATSVVQQGIAHGRDYDDFCRMFYLTYPVIGDEQIRLKVQRKSAHRKLSVSHSSELTPSTAEDKPWAAFKQRLVQRCRNMRYHEYYQTKRDHLLTEGLSSNPAGVCTEISPRRSSVSANDLTPRSHEAFLLIQNKKSLWDGESSPELLDLFKETFGFRTVALGSKPTTAIAKKILEDWPMLLHKDFLFAEAELIFGPEKFQAISHNRNRFLASLEALLVTSHRSQWLGFARLIQDLQQQDKQRRKDGGKSNTACSDVIVVAERQEISEHVTVRKGLPCLFLLLKSPSSDPHEVILTFADNTMRPGLCWEDGISCLIFLYFIFDLPTHGRSQLLLLLQTILLGHLDTGHKLNQRTKDLLATLVTLMRKNFAA